MRLIDADRLINLLEEYLQDFKSMVSEHGKGLAHGTRLAIERIAEQPSIELEAMRPQWIPVTERLPENAAHPGAFCPKYMVMTKYGVTEGWYNPDRESWFILFWFMTERFLEHEISFERGDIPRVLKVPLHTGIVTAWMPLPEPYTLADVKGDDNAQRVKPLEFDWFKNDTLKDVQPVVHGKWMPNNFDNPAFFFCSKCNCVFHKKTNFCPNCGAKMGEEDPE